MPHASVATIIEKNRLSSEHAFIALLEIRVRDPSDREIKETLYVCRNSEDIEYQGDTYIASNFDFQLNRAKNEVPELEVMFKDITRAVIARMEEFGGGVGSQVIIRVVNTGNIEQPPEFEERFTVISGKASVDSYTVHWRLGAENYLNRRFPFRLVYRDRCQWTYKGEECGYAGSLETCDYTLQGANGCKEHGNEERFGAFPGVRNLNS